MAMGRAVERTERMEARAAAIGTLFEAGALALPGGGPDPVESAIVRVAVDQAVDEEIAVLKARIDSDQRSPALSDRG